MKRTLTIAWILSLAASCSREREPTEQHEKAHSEPHEHEERHDEVPRSIALSDAVIEQAGIVTAPTLRLAIAPTVRLPGEIAAHPDREATIAARIDGVIEAIRVRPGDPVKRGDVLATVRAPNLQSLRAAEAALRAKASSARANAERVAGLVDKRMASRQEALAANAEADALEAEARAARERLRALGVSRSRRAVTFDVLAPMEGVILDRSVAAGAPVTAETVVATMVSTDEVWFMAHVFERDVARIDEGRDASVVLNAYPERPFYGEVEYISHKVDQGARTLSARIPLSNPEGRLKLGLYGTAHVVISGESTAPVLAVPKSAVTRMLGKPVVFVKHPDGHFEVHEVVIGRADTENTEVVHGLREGEEVVTRGAFTVKSALLRGTFGEDED